MSAGYADRPGGTGYPRAHSWYYWLLAGGFLGPLPGNSLSVLIPTLASFFQQPGERMALSISAYMIPFATMQFISGALSDRWSRTRVIALGFTAFGLGCLLAALATHPLVFFAAAALAGTGNALTTPIIMALIGDLIPSARLGRTLGAFYSAQTAALFMAPLLAGYLAEYRWQVFFYALAVPACLLATAFARPPAQLRASSGTAREQAATRADDEPFRLFTLRHGLLWLSSAMGYLAVTGIAFLVALDLTLRWGLATSRVGLIVSGFGLAGAVASPLAGRWADRVGGSLPAITASVATACLWGLIALAPNVLSISVLFVLLGIASVTLWGGLHPLAIASSARRRGTLTSIFNGCKFIGFGLAPVLYLPVYHAWGSQAAYGTAALIAMALAGLIALYGRVSARSLQPGSGAPPPTSP